MTYHPFDEVLNLEQNFYDEGYKQGLADGEAAGLAEGRTLGLEKGFEKFCSSSRLCGKSLVWANRLAISRNLESHSTKRAQEALNSPSPPESTSTLLNPIPSNSKISKHVKALHALVEPETLSIHNTDEAVSDFDDRLKRARAKSKLIEKLIDESQTKTEKMEKFSKS